MNPIIRNILAVIAGVIVGSFINIGLVNIGPSIIPPPEGADITTMEGLKETMKLFKPTNFIFPYLGHILGALAGAFTAAKIAVSHNMKFAIGLGLFFLAGGITMVYSVPGPLWFNVLDLISYIPAALIGGKLATK